MPHFWNTGDGRRRGLVVIVVFLVFGAAYDFIREGPGSLTGLQYLLLALSTVALAPIQDQPTERRSIRIVVQSPRYLGGALAFVVSMGIFVYRVARDIRHR